MDYSPETGTLYIVERLAEISKPAHRIEGLTRKQAHHSAKSFSEDGNLYFVLRENSPDDYTIDALYYSGQIFLHAD